MLTTFAQVFILAARHWRVLAFIGALGGMGFEGYHLAKVMDEKAAITAQAETLKHRLATMALLQATDAKRAAADADQLQQLQDTARDTPPNTHTCLDRAAVGRLRSIK